jgi:ABC-2 type transport system permease protein
MKSKPFYRLVRTGFFELFREPKTLFFIMIFPMFFLLLFGVMGMIIPDSETMKLSFIEFMFPGILIFALVSTGLFGTSTPIIEMRKKGTLRLFQITPLSKTTFLLSQITVRFIISFIQIVLLLGIGIIIGVIKLNVILPVFLVSLLGMCMILTIGFLFGGILNSAELAGGLLGGLSAPILMFSGVLLPLTIFPEVFEKIAMAFPFTYLGDLVRTVTFSNFDSMFPIYINVSVILACTLLFFFIVKLTFKWEKS